MPIRVDIFLEVKIKISGRLDYRASLDKELFSAPLSPAALCFPYLTFLNHFLTFRLWAPQFIFIIIFLFLFPKLVLK